MPSPFPGVDPFVELSGRWTGFHHILIAHCSELLNAELPQDYAALVDERLEPKQSHIDIISLALRETVTRIEILCADYKSDDHRDNYLSVRSKLLSRGMNLVEIDLLSVGERILAREQMPVADYYAYVSRGERAGTVEVYAWSIREALPVLGIPSESGSRVAIDLGAAFKTTYDRGRYDRCLRYYLPLTERVSEADREWARARAQTMLQ